MAGTFASARVVMLREPVSGVLNIAFTDQTEVVRSSGARASFGDILAAATVEAVGQAGTADTLIARRVVIL